MTRSLTAACLALVFTAAVSSQTVDARAGMSRSGALRFHRPVGPVHMRGDRPLMDRSLTRSSAPIPALTPNGARNRFAGQHRGFGRGGLPFTYGPWGDFYGQDYDPADMTGDNESPADMSTADAPGTPYQAMAVGGAWSARGCRSQTQWVSSAQGSKPIVVVRC